MLRNDEEIFTEKSRQINNLQKENAQLVSFYHIHWVFSLDTNFTHYALAEGIRAWSHMLHPLVKLPQVVFLADSDSQLERILANISKSKLNLDWIEFKGGETQQWRWFESM